MDMLIADMSQVFRKARSVNQTSNGYVAKVPTATEPRGDAASATGASVLELGTGGATSRQRALLVFFGVGSDTNTFSCRAIGWHYLPGSTPQTGLWIPNTLGEYQLTLSSTYPGIAGYVIDNTNLFASTVTLVSGSTAANDLVNPATTAGVASVSLALKGCQKLELTFTTGGVATSCNALVALL